MLYFRGFTPSQYITLVSLLSYPSGIVAYREVIIQQNLKLFQAVSNRRNLN